MATTPTLECPVGGERLLDPYNWLLARWSPFIPDLAPTTAVQTQDADLNPEGTAASTWVAPALLLANDGTEDSTTGMAHADTAGKVNTLKWSTAGGGGVGEVTAAHLIVRTRGVWSDPPGYSGDATVRFLVSWGGRSWYTFSDL